jgi:hypothetical protein
MTVSSKLQALYQAIPTFTCRPGCNDCCGPVPFAKEEWKEVKIKRQGQPNCITCAYSENGGCSIYEARPFMCRLFGASEVPSLVCEHGCGPEKPLSVKQTQILTDRYRKIAGDTPAGWNVDTSHVGVLGTSGTAMSLARPKT